MKIMKYLYEHWNDNVEASEMVRFVEQECTEDDIYEFINLRVMLENLDEGFTKELWKHIK